MNAKKVTKITLNVLIVVFALATSFCLFFVIQNHAENIKDKALLDDFVITQSDADRITENLSVSKPVKNVLLSKSTSLIDGYREKYNNDEVVGILSIAGTKINTVLMQSSNNDYYVRRLPNKKKHVTGSVFVDYRTRLIDDKNVIIYGHNANNYDIPFRYLRNYLNENFYLAHKYIDVVTDDKNARYEIFSVYVSSADYEHLNVNFSSDEAWVDHLNGLKEKSIYGTNISLGADDSIITLQTCLLKDDALIVISAKKM